MNNLLTSLSKFISEGTASGMLGQQGALGAGQASGASPFRKFVVIESIVDPIDIVKNLDAYAKRYSVLGISNFQEFISTLPRNSIVGRPLEADGGGPCIFLLPFFPSHLSFPCKPGELVWTIFEKPEVSENAVGYWMCKVPDISFVDDVNHSHFPRRWESTMYPPGARDQTLGTKDPKFEFKNGAVEITVSGERKTDPNTQVISGDENVFEALIKDTDGGKLVIHEAVPRYNKRPADMALEGSNNTLIVLGADRESAAADLTDAPDGTRQAEIPATDKTKSVGSIDIVAGRGQTARTSGAVARNSLDFEELDKSLKNLQPGEGDPDYKYDRSRIVVAMSGGDRIDVRMNEGIDKTHSAVMSDISIVDGTVDLGVVAAKSDVVRLIGRREIMIVCTNHDTVDGKLVDKFDPDEHACAILKPNGDIVLKPAKKGYLRLGDENADRAILCTDSPAVASNGQVSSAPLITTAGGQVGTGAANQGTFSTKVLVSAK